MAEELELLENRVADIERRLGKTIAAWNSFIDPANGGVTRARVAELEQRITDMVTTWNESVDARAAASKERADAMLKLVDKIVTRFAALEARADAAEKRCTLSYRGVWGGTVVEYARGDAVTSSGSLWVATQDAPGRPGAPDSGWQLAIKSGAAS